ncbi:MULTISPECIES: hypothetical protein [Aeromonas]|uniref:hypothetical protein n=1 Tax=Aeromonas TaxID=642 RepID=UPI0029DB8924|nr:hypothetical protein [Aeromonas caviae]MDX7853115.1 hypothetical protein [Aeromonas caviae]
MSNDHRKEKRSFQALLNSDENEFINVLKKLAEEKTDRGLLIALGKHYLSTKCKGVCDGQDKL